MLLSALLLAAAGQAAPQPVSVGSDDRPCSGRVTCLRRSKEERPWRRAANGPPAGEGRTTGRQASAERLVQDQRLGDLPPPTTHAVLRSVDGMPGLLHHPLADHRPGWSASTGKVVHPESGWEAGVGPASSRDPRPVPDRILLAPAGRPGRASVFQASSPGPTLPSPGTSPPSSGGFGPGSGVGGGTGGPSGASGPSGIVWGRRAIALPPSPGRPAGLGHWDPRPS